MSRGIALRPRSERSTTLDIVRIDERWLWLGDTVSSADAGLTILRAHPGAWWLVVGDEMIGPLADDVPLVLCVAQLADYKGHQYLIDAVPSVLKSCPRTIFALAGDGPLRGPLMAQARSRGIESAVRFLGYRNDVPDLIVADNSIEHIDDFLHMCEMDVFGMPLVSCL